MKQILAITKNKAISCSVQIGKFGRGLRITTKILSLTRKKGSFPRGNGWKSILENIQFQTLDIQPTPKNLACGHGLKQSCQFKQDWEYLPGKLPTIYEINVSEAKHSLLEMQVARKHHGCTVLNTIHSSSSISVQSPNDWNFEYKYTLILIVTTVELPTPC